MTALILRDLRLAFRNFTAMAMGPLFFIIFIALCVIALSADMDRLTEMANPLIWLAVILSLFLSFPHIFAGDYRDRTLEALILSGEPRGNLVIAKGIVYFITTFLPFVAIIPIAGLFLNLSSEQISAICLSILVSAPALVIYGLLTGALLGRQRSSGIFAILLAAPLILPVLIFGLSAASSYLTQGLHAVEFRALTGINLIALAVGIPATAAALNANLE